MSFSYVMVNDEGMNPQEFTTYVARKVPAMELFETMWHEFCAVRADLPTATTLHDTYTRDLAYLRSTTAWEIDGRKQQVYKAIEHYWPARATSVLDVGCALGQTGIELLLRGYEQVIFCDYEGLPLEFLRGYLPCIAEFAGRWQVVPYGQEQPADVVIAADVLEHVGKQLHFMHWLGRLSRQGFLLTYPHIASIEPPYDQTVLDGWVDDEMIGGLLFYRYELLEWTNYQGGRIAVVRHRQD